MASFGGQQRRHDRNDQCPLLDSGGIFEAASKNSSQIILETPPADVVETISRYFEAPLGSSGQTKEIELCHPVADHIDCSADTDSGDSLFITQHPLTEVVRSVKRCHSKKRSEPIDPEESGEEDGRSSHQRRQAVSAIKTSKTVREGKGEKYKLKKYSLPFLDKVDRSKCLSGRERAYRGTHLPFLKSVTLASLALGGFFKSVKALKFSKKKATLDLALPKRCLDEDDGLLPLPEQDEQSEGSDEDDIRVVENYVFAPSVKKEHRQIWYQHRPRVKTPVSLVSKTSVNSISNQTPARSWRSIPRKCNMTKEQLCTEVDRWVRSSRCRTYSEEPDIYDDDSIVGVPQRKKSPSKKRAGNIHKHQEEELVEEDLLNANVVTSLTECELLTINQVLDIVGEGSRGRTFMNLSGEIINSPNADVREITGSCLENAQEDFEDFEISQNMNKATELGMKAEHALIQRSDNPDDMDTKRKRKKKKRRTKTVDNEVQSSVSQSTEMESKKKERQMYEGLVVVHEGTIGRGTEEMISEITSDCALLPEINAISHSDEMVSSSNKKKKRRKAEKETMVQHQEGDTEKLNETVKSSVSESRDVVSQRKNKKHMVKDRVIETPKSIEECHEKENEPSQAGKITSSRKKKKKERSKDPINIIHEDTAAPKEVDSIVISLNKSECYALMEDNTVSHKKEKKKISTQLVSEEKLQYGDEISQNMNKATELGMEADHALIQRSANPDDMDTQRKRKKKKKRRTSVDNDLQSSASQSTEMESKRKKKERQMYEGLVVVHEGTIGRRTEEMISQIISGCALLPKINAISHSDEMVSSSNKKKKKRLNDPTKDYLTADYNDYRC